MARLQLDLGPEPNECDTYTSVAYDEDGLTFWTWNGSWGDQSSTVGGASGVKVVAQTGPLPVPVEEATWAGVRGGFIGQGPATLHLATGRLATDGNRTGFDLALQCARPILVRTLLVGADPRVAEPHEPATSVAAYVRYPGIVMAGIQPEGRLEWETMEGTTLFFATSFAATQGQGTLRYTGPSGVSLEWDLATAFFSVIEDGPGRSLIEVGQTTFSAQIDVKAFAVGCIRAVPIVVEPDIPDCGGAA